MIIIQFNHCYPDSLLGARFFVTGGIIASAEGTSLVGESGVILPQKIFKFGGSKMLFSALVMRYVSEK